MSMSWATKNRALTSVRPDTTVSSLRVFTGAFANGAGSSIRWGRGGSTTSELLVHANVAQLPKMFWSTTFHARLLSWRIKTIREVLIKAVGVTRRGLHPTCSSPVCISECSTQGGPNGRCGDGY